MQLEKASPPLNSRVFSLLLNLLHSSQCGQAGIPFPAGEVAVPGGPAGVSSDAQKQTRVSSIPCLPALLLLCHLHGVQIIRAFCCLRQDFENRSSEIKVAFLPFLISAELLPHLRGGG